MHGPTGRAQRAGRHRVGKCVPSQTSVVIPANTTQVICTVSFPCFGTDPGPNNSSVHISASSLEVSYKGKRPTQIVSTLQSSCTRTATQDTHGYNVHSKQERHFSLVGALLFPVPIRSRRMRQAAAGQLIQTDAWLNFRWSRLANRLP
jgi:hypothetical protein